jgi:hypothetical protein
VVANKYKFMKKWSLARLGGHGPDWTGVVRRDIDLKRVVRGCLQFIRGTNVGMFSAYWMEPRYGIRHFIEQYGKDLRVHLPED